MVDGGGRTPADLLPLLRDTVDRLSRTVERLDERTLRGPSLLPGWSRAHVLAHIAGSADSRVRLLTAARTGRDIPQYRSEESRTEQIDRDAALPSAELRALVRRSTAGAIDAIATHPPDRWDATAEWLGGGRRPVHRAVPSLLQELQIHHVDLDAGYTAQDWPDWFAAPELEKVVNELRMPNLRVRATDEPIDHTHGDGPLVIGNTRALLAWLIGRSAGMDLTVIPRGPLPRPPSWRQ